MKRNRGFALIELLIVVSIIGLLTSTAATAGTSVRMKARDARRVQEMRSIITALESYYIDNGKYPGSGPSQTRVRWAWSSMIDGGQRWIIADTDGIVDLNVELEKYVILPKDPLDNGGVAPFICCSYTYFVNADGSQYDLVTIFEEKHSLRCEAKNWVSYTGGWIGLIPSFPGLGNSWCGGTMSSFPDAKNIYSAHL